MELINIGVNVVLFFLLGLFIKNYLPSYMDEKGKNPATKEDIQEITRKTEEIQKEFKEEFELFSSDMKFKYDFYFKQYSELYSKLYAIVLQSEYIRSFVIVWDDENKITFDEAPFIELSPTYRVNESMEFSKGKSITVTKTEEKIETPLSQFNKQNLYEYIIAHGEYATPKLLKIAVAYRFVYRYYSGNTNEKSFSCQEAANIEEFRLIKEMVCCIVSEYNYFRKELKMDYDESELKTGIPKL